MMKRAILPVLMMIGLSACQNTKKQEAALRDSIMDFHEKVMGDDEKAMIGKMKLDTVISKADSLKADKQLALKLSADLSKADDAMSDWMKKFDPDITGKAHDSLMTYLRDEKKQVTHVDSMLSSATANANLFLKKIHIK